MDARGPCRVRLPFRISAPPIPVVHKSLQFSGKREFVTLGPVGLAYCRAFAGAPIGVRDQEHETLEELVRYMEQVSGRSIRTRADVDRYLEFLAEIHPQQERTATIAHAWLIAKRLVLAALTAFAAFQYFEVDAVTEVLTIDKVRFLPPPVRHTTRT